MHRITKIILFIFLLALVSGGTTAVIQGQDEDRVESEQISDWETTSEEDIAQEGEILVFYEEVDPYVLESITGKGLENMGLSSDNGPSLSARIILGDEIDVDRRPKIVFRNGGNPTTNAQVNRVTIEAE
jgi:hypothetical protein